MIDLSMFFSEDELWDIIQQFMKEAKDIKRAHKRYKEFVDRIEKAKKPFFKKQQEVIEKRKEKGENPTPTLEELEEIWREFSTKRREIEEELSEKW